ncbi:MAG: acyltransferase family protein [Prevotella sp.]|nr:acyltransferase family protein [Prevotella sp.]
MIETLQSLRFIFFVMIFMSHFEYDGLPAFDAGGDCGVSFFFILSGFVLSSAYGNKVSSDGFRYRQFMARRVKKLYPLHLLCLLAFVVINIRSMDAGTLVRLLPNLLLVQSWIPSAGFYFSANAVSWFLSDILLCYSVFPAVFQAVHRMTPMALTAAWAAVLAAYAVLLCNIPDAMTNAIVYVFPPVRTVDFAIGVTLWRVAAWLKKRRIAVFESRLTATAAELAVFAALAMTLAAHPYVNLQIRTACLFWPVNVAIILLFACEKAGWGVGMAAPPQTFDLAREHQFSAVHGPPDGHLHHLGLSPPPLLHHSGTALLARPDALRGYDAGGNGIGAIYY